jgi:hypothetical protein
MGMPAPSTAGMAPPTATMTTSSPAGTTTSHLQPTTTTGTSPATLPGAFQLPASSNGHALSTGWPAQPSSTLQLPPAAAVALPRCAPHELDEDKPRSLFSGPETYASQQPSSTFQAAGDGRLRGPVADSMLPSRTRSDSMATAAAAVASLPGPPAAHADAGQADGTKFVVHPTLEVRCCRCCCKYCACALLNPCFEPFIRMAACATVHGGVNRLTRAAGCRWHGCTYMHPRRCEGCAQPAAPVPPLAALSIMLTGPCPAAGAPCLPAAQAGSRRACACPGHLRHEWRQGHS